ncbi:hypothetical protein J2X63_002220 [Agromyces sp. 3263]|uniref:hypothetical protein n=1 Tax=Agromyces sp. 3263 TaxID=2817750 RepID=UPI002856384A|nr:hypothetical protein [Agromyces sp. 3263]MDR6906534.1 hypothetical protein [Agromyces sp. 3263]
MMSRGARAIRGTAVAVFATFVASLAHTLGGGTPPGPVALLIALAFSVPLAMLVTGARARLARTIVAALVAQASLHLCYALGSAGPIAPSGGHAGGVGSAGHAGHAGRATVTHTLTMPPGVALDHGHAWMPLAHLVAAAITVLALVSANRAVAAVVSAVLALVRRLTSVPVPVDARPRRQPADAAVRRLLSLPLLASIGSRGPPVAALAA